MSAKHISPEERQRFVQFMRQEKWKGTALRYEHKAYIYQLETSWLYPRHPTFYIGSAKNVAQRVQQHREDVLQDAPPFTPAEINEAFSLPGLNGKACKMLRQGIITTCQFYKAEINSEVLEDVVENPPRILDRMKHPLTFPYVVLERERRWIFYGLQQEFSLTNVERICKHMVDTLRTRPRFDVRQTPFESAEWNPIVRAYLLDEPCIQQQMRERE